MLTTWHVIPRRRADLRRRRFLAKNAWVVHGIGMTRVLPRFITAWIVLHGFDDLN